MATYGDLSKFTNAELSQMCLTHKDLENLSFDELLRLAQIRLERFQPQTQSEGFFKSVLAAVVAQITADALEKALNPDNWLPVLRQIAKFFCDNP